MKTIAKHHEIITLLKILPGYVKDCFSGNVYKVWGRYYKYVEYRYVYTSFGPRRETDREFTFINKSDAEAFSKSRNENKSPC